MIKTTGDCHFFKQYKRKLKILVTLMNEYYSHLMSCKWLIWAQLHEDSVHSSFSFLYRPVLHISLVESFLTDE